MGKFKVGDRVRRVKASDWPDQFGKVGKEYTVLEVPSDYLVVVIAGQSGASASAFELVAPEAWQPKVGDRVVATEGCNVDIENHWNTYFRKDNGDIIDGALVVASVYEHKIGLSNKVGRSFFYMKHESLKLALAPAPLTITAGKFYKTRDGRKVGPMEAGAFGGIYDISRAVTGQPWYSDGAFIKGETSKLDLIAEWVDEPAVVANDNASKFKVGDKIRHKGLGYEGYIKEIRDGDIAITHWPKTGWGGCDPFEDLELISPSTTPQPTAIVALIENGQPKPAFEPKVHASEADATKEAERLAGLYRGQRFGVFVLSDTRETDKPDYGHEWKNLAAVGQKIHAIKELRSLTGMKLKPAKDVVENFLDEIAA
ncbi:hypothetical protein [Rhizobium leucaenae]|uniref:hypothetical protein n=1 Tax=Rhizobium leucaenae TaxID=29450 RepID=UPI00048C009B|nr:hypothetical protein [Rhizobium leucaenae]